MRPVLVRAVGVALVAVSGPLLAQGPRQLEVSVLGGTAHTDRTARLVSEEATEPYFGLRVDARLRSLWGGRVGLALQVDRYRMRDDRLTSPPCLEICAAATPPQGAVLVPYEARTADTRLMLGPSWRRPLASWLHADLLGLAGVRQLVSDQRFGSLDVGEQPVTRMVIGGEAGLSAQWRTLVGGVAFQYSSGSQWRGVRRGQNRVALRAGYALPLGG